MDEMSEACISEDVDGLDENMHISQVHARIQVLKFLDRTDRSMRGRDEADTGLEALRCIELLTSGRDEPNSAKDSRIMSIVQYGIRFWYLCITRISKDRTVFSWK